MMFKTHVVFGFLVGLFLIQLVHPGNQILFITLVVIGSMLPDIDHPDSKVGKHVKIIGALFEHRGFFHSFFAVGLFTYAVYSLLHSNLFGFAAFAGYLSHILIDCISVQGIMPLHPISRLRISGFIKTNSFVEYAIFVLLSIFSVYKLVSL
jgi:inner membrane protein